MKALTKLAIASAGVATLAYAWIAYVRHFHVHSPEQALGAAMEPINLVSIVCVYIFGGAALLFGICALAARFMSRGPKA